MSPQSFGNVLEMIGHTPLMAVRRIDTGPCQLSLKLENQNPGGSIKDRIGLYLIQAAERAGHIRPGSILIEATAGNTGLGLALVAAQKGYRLVLAIPDKMSQEKIFHLRAMGAEVVMTRSDVSKGHPEYYRDVAERLARETPNSYFVNQFGNPVNAQAHEETTAPEIWEQMDGKLDAVVCGAGTGGTLAGLSHFFARTAPRVAMVLADPLGSGLASFARTGKLPEKMTPWLVEGIGGDSVPPVADFSRVTATYSIPDPEAFATCRALLKHEGIIAGTSTGTLLAAALRYCREQQQPKRVVTFVCDSGNKYLSKVYNDYWMLDQGFLER
ncbi:MAG TPA: cysteine synthase family protein, partial [Steroidobacteraceae bacterium]|nr:cysteine synthase family protein [Steroidobacteraceae bacterium]